LLVLRFARIMDLELLIKEGYVYQRDSVCDIGIRDGKIVSVDDEISRNDTDDVIEADGNLVAPGFVDAHVHMDKAYEAAGERFPKHNDGGTDLQTIGLFETERYTEIPREDLILNAVKLGKEAAADGTLHMRTHVTVGDRVGGTKALECILEAKDRLDGVLDLQTVALPAGGILNTERTSEVIRECMEMGADLVGGIDPATASKDIELTLQTWFDIAQEYDAGIDTHIQHPGTLGMNVLNRMAEKTVERDYQDQVTASHSYCMAELGGKKLKMDTPELTDVELKANSEAELDRAIPKFGNAGMKFVTCHPSTRPNMPIYELDEHDVPLGWGSDNISDWVIRHAKPDALQGALVNAFKLDYNLYSFATNQGLDLLWNMATHGGANVLGIDDYGIEEGNSADLVVFDEPSPQWAVINQATREYVLKESEIIAREGENLVTV